MAICLKLVHHQELELAMSYPWERCLQITFPENGAISDVIPRDVPGCQWNDVEAPWGLRIRVNLKFMLTLKENMQNWVSFFSLSLSLKLLALKLS
jgi:hypothetical protein